MQVSIGDILVSPHGYEVRVLEVERPDAQTLCVTLEYNDGNLSKLWTSDESQFYEQMASAGFRRLMRSSTVEPKPQDLCTCPSFDLFNRGCQCGYLSRARAS